MKRSASELAISLLFHEFQQLVYSIHRGMSTLDLEGGAWGTTFILIRKKCTVADVPFKY